MTKKVKNAGSGDVILPADDSEIGGLLLTVILISLALTMMAILFAKQIAACPTGFVTAC